MTTRLLPKSEVLAAKNAERKREIDEGAALAKKVDALRQTSLEEEAKLSIFREKNVREASDAIKRKIAEHDCIQKKVEQLEKRKIEALKPVFEEERRLKQWENDINAVYFANLEEKETLDEWKRHLDAREKSLVTDEQRIVDRRKRSEEVLEIAYKKHEEGNATFLKALQAEEASKVSLAAREQEVKRLEKVLEYREFHTNSRREQMDKEQLEINSKMTYIQDQYAVLERTAKELRTKNGKRKT